MSERPPAGPPDFPRGTFRIDREGAWRHEGQEVTHPGVVENLYANLRVEGETHYLQVGPVRIPVEVDDAPFVVTRVEPVTDSATGGEWLRVHLSDGSSERLDLDSVWIGAREAPYCRVKGGRFVARLSVAAWLQLAPLVEEDPEGRSVLRVGARRVPLPRRG